MGIMVPVGTTGGEYGIPRTPEGRDAITKIFALEGDGEVVLKVFIFLCYRWIFTTFYPIKCEIFTECIYKIFTYGASGSPYLP